MAITPRGKFEPPYVGSYAVQVWQCAKPVFGEVSPPLGGEGRVRGRVSSIPSTHQ